MPEIGLLNINQWKTLERDERCLRNQISSRKYNAGDLFVTVTLKKGALGKSI